MNFNELKNKALSLPLEPGVYIMRDCNDQVIYVGKAKKLKNRVSQYFQDTASHTPKTRLMVSKICNFDVIVAANEFEALVLECSQIKRYVPKYNILLKDDKGYPYLRLDMRERFPVITLASRIENDGAEYFGPFGSRGVTQSIINAVRLTLKLPDCSKTFPKDLGKGRVCLNYHMNACAGWCQKTDCEQEYRLLMEQARQLLAGDYRKVTSQIKEQMLQAADDLNFELAATLRDRLNAVEALGKKQFVTGGTHANIDVIGFAQTETKACFSVLHFNDGNLVDKDYEILPAQDEPETAVSSLLKQYYLTRRYAPKLILLPFAVQDAELFEQLLEQEYGKRTRFAVPQRGDNMRLVEMALKNAEEEAVRVTGHEEKLTASLRLLGNTLSMQPPHRIESFDISNISGTDIVGSMVVFVNGKPLKSDYKKFKINDMQEQDDYGSMRQMLRRRFSHYVNNDSGFDQLPDLILIDGGASHAQVAAEVASEMQIFVRIFGMVKDDRHRTRALITAEGQEIHIDTQQSLFSLIGRIQEETHRFAITYHRKLRSNRLRYSELDQIPGIGQKRKADLLRQYKSIKAISAATLPELERVLPKNVAMAVFQHFHDSTEK